MDVSEPNKFIMAPRFDHLNSTQIRRTYLPQVVLKYWSKISPISKNQPSSNLASPTSTKVTVSLRFHGTVWSTTSSLPPLKTVKLWFGILNKPNRSFSSLSLVKVFLSTITLVIKKLKAVKVRLRQKKLKLFGIQSSLPNLWLRPMTIGTHLSISGI